MFLNFSNNISSFVRKLLETNDFPFDLADINRKGKSIETQHKYVRNKSPASILKRASDFDLHRILLSFFIYMYLILLHLMIFPLIDATMTSVAHLSWNRLRCQRKKTNGNLKIDSRVSGLSFRKSGRVNYLAILRFSCLFFKWRLIWYILLGQKRWCIKVCQSTFIYRSGVSATN